MSDPKRTVEAALSYGVATADLEIPTLTIAERRDTQRIGVVPAVYAEFQAGVNKGYPDLQAVVKLIQQGRIDLATPTAQEIFQESALPVSFDVGERETLAVAKARGYPILTNENQIKNWCKREQIEYWDLPGLLRALWRVNVVSRDLVRSLIDQIEAKDRIVFRNKEAILQE